MLVPIALLSAFAGLPPPPPVDDEIAPPPTLEAPAEEEETALELLGLGFRRVDLARVFASAREPDHVVLLDADVATVFDRRAGVIQCDPIGK